MADYVGILLPTFARIYLEDFLDTQNLKIYNLSSF